MIIEKHPTQMDDDPETSINALRSDIYELLALLTDLQQAQIGEGIVHYQSVLKNTLHIVTDLESQLELFRTENLRFEL